MLNNSINVSQYFQRVLSLAVVLLTFLYFAEFAAAYSGEVVLRKTNQDHCGSLCSFYTYDCDPSTSTKYITYDHNVPGTDHDWSTSCPTRGGLQSYCEGTGSGIVCVLKCEDISDPGTCGQTSGCFYYRGGRTEEPRCVEGTVGASCAGAACHSNQMCHSYATKSGSGPYAGSVGFCGGTLELGPGEKCETSNECVGALLCQGGTSSVSGGGGTCTAPIIDNNSVVLPACPTDGNHLCLSGPVAPNTVDKSATYKCEAGKICYGNAGGGTTEGTDTCRTMGNGTFQSGPHAGERAFECQPSPCSGGRFAYTGSNSTCPAGAGVCCWYGSTPGSGSSPSSGGSTPTPPTDGPGYCGDSVPTGSTMRRVGEPTCAPNASNVQWRQRSTDASGYDPYCDSITEGQQRYFYACITSSATPIPTPTPFTAASQGALCNPTQGPWQCFAPNVCVYVTGSEGRCCPATHIWRDNTCVLAPTPVPYTPPAGGSGPAPTATPVATGSTCNDYIPASNIHQVCRSGSCLAGENENTGGNGACSAFYGSSFGKCCQLPPATGPAGSSCSLSGRPCNPSQNTSTGTNNACSGCGGYCVGSGTSGTCQNPYAP